MTDDRGVDEANCETGMGGGEAPTGRGRPGRERKLEALQGVTRQLLLTTDRDEVAAIAVDAAESVLGLSLSGVHLLAEDRDALVGVAGTDDLRALLGEVPTYTADGGPVARFVWKIFERGETVVIEDASDHERITEETAAQSGILLPLGDRGVFITSSTEPYAFDDEDVHLAEILAANLEAALDRIGHERAFETLHDASRRLIQARSETGACKLAVEAARDLLGYPYTGVHLLDGDRDALVPVAWTDALEEHIGGTPPTIERGEGLVWTAVDAGEPRIYDDVREHEKRYAPDTTIRSEMYLPLGDHGVVLVAATEPGVFDDRDLRVVNILAAGVEAALVDAAARGRLRSRERELERQNERLDAFVGVVSHDLRNPLNVAKGQLRLGLETGERDHFERAGDALDRMERLVEDLLTLARQGRTVGETAAVDLAAVARRAWTTVDTADATVEIREPPPIEADGDRLGQLLENLFRNAVEHAGAGAHVVVGGLSDGGGFYVEDDGPGIPADERERVFEYGHSTAPDGTGLGLAIVREIADAHGWTVGVEEGTDGGARFEFRGVDRA